jgi:transposase
LLRQGRDAIAVRRAEVVLASAQDESLRDIARRLHFSNEYVRRIIHRFNAEGLDSLKAHYENGGRPATILPEHESNLVELALTPPDLTGQPFTHWSLQTLCEVAVKRKLVPHLGVETARGILKKHRVSLQRTKTWKKSTDPEFEVKKRGSSGSTRQPRKTAKRSSASMNSDR